MGDFLSELKRRNVVRIGLLYAVSGWVLLQVADVLVGLLGLPDWALRLVGMLLLLGFPLALIFAWVYELTPEGIKRERDVDRSASITSHTGQRLNIVIVVLLAMAVTLLALQQFSGRDANPSGPEQAAASVAADAPGVSVSDESPSIAVLPFINMSGDAENEYFSDGLSEELLNVLARVPDLRVAARTSSFHFKNKTGDVAEIGRELGVANVLEGSVRKSGETVRVTVQLIKVEDGFHLWSDTYDRKLDDIFAIQDDIASHVVGALTAALLGDDDAAAKRAGETLSVATAGTDKFAAYDRLLLARQYHNRGSFESLAIAREYYLEGIEYGRVVFSQWNTGSISPADAAREMKRAADEVAAIDAAAGVRRGDLVALQAETRIVERSGGEMSIDDWQNVAQEAIGRLEEARRLSPNDSSIYQSLAQTYHNAGQSEAALEVLNQARVIDPYSVRIAGRLSALYNFSLNRPDLALEEARRIQRIEPDNPDGFSREAAVHMRFGDLPAAYRARAKSIELDPDDHELRGWLSALYLSVGLVDEARVALEQAEAIGPGEPLTLMTRASYEFYVGNLDAALEIAERAIAERLPGRHDSEFTFNAIVIMEAYKNGEYDDALEAAQRISGSIDLDNPEFSNEYSAYVALQFAIPSLSAKGNEERVGKVLDAVTRCTTGTCSDPRLEWEKRHDDALVEYYRGNHAAAVARYADMVDMAPLQDYWWWMFERDPMRADILSDPGVAEAVDRYRQRLAVARTEIERAMAEGSESAVAEPAVVAQARAQLAQRLSVPAASIRLDELETVTWPDGSIGCPEPEMVYTQALVPGTRVVLSVAGAAYHYHAREGGEPFLCETPGKALPPG
ncbi:MAG: hypothetical protein P8X53_13215 [Chromatiales bacterium]